MNNGEGDLEIKRVKSSCGCTAAMLESKLLKPNEKSALKIEFDTSFRTLIIYCSALNYFTKHNREHYPAGFTHY